MLLTIQRFRIFGTSLLLILVLAVCQVCYYIMLNLLFPETAVINMESPVSFLYGPLLYFVYLTAAGRTTTVKEKISHCIPFIVSLFFYTVLLYMIAFQVAGKEKAIAWYQEFSAGSIVSLFVYLVVIIAGGRKKPMLNRPLQNFMGQLSVLYVVIAAMQFASLVQFFVPSLHAGVDVQDIKYALLLVVALFSIREVMASDPPAQQQHSEKAVLQAATPVLAEPELPRYQRSVLDEATLKQYAIRVQCYLEESRVYLNPGLSLEMLAAKTEIPRHHFSQLLSTFFDNSFYQFIAGHRIVYAMQLLKTEKDDLTLESFAYECGFNSKTSFNRYFKEYVGCTPSEYRIRATGKGIKKQLIQDV
jgi:AraC-like DNA-binding protein